MKAKKVLRYLIKTLIVYLEELAVFDATHINQFAYGEKTAYIECLQIVQFWRLSKKHGLNFNIESKFPLLFR